MSNRKLEEALAQETDFDLESHTILMGYMGSISHGTHIPPKEKAGIDDKDVMGIAIPPNKYFIGLSKYDQSDIFHKEWDIIVYNIQKMFSLLIKSNPNVISLLWLPNSMYLKKTDAAKEIIESRDLFISKKMYDSFCGYAHGQLKKMERFSTKGYMGEKRKALVDEFGYDCKNAAHLIRLLAMCVETLQEGQVYVNREGRDADKLLAIKKGEWSLDQVKKEADVLFKKADEVYKRSPLKEEPDKVGAEYLLTRILGREMRKRLERERI